MAWKRDDFVQQTGWNSLVTGTVEEHCQDGDASPVHAVWNRTKWKHMKVN